MSGKGGIATNVLGSVAANEEVENPHNSRVNYLIKNPT